MSEPTSDEEYDSASRVVSSTVTGTFSEAAVLGLMSWVVEGLRLMERLCSVSPIWSGISEDIVKSVGFKGRLGLLLSSR